MISQIPELKKISDCFKSLKEKGIIEKLNFYNQNHTHHE